MNEIVHFSIMNAPLGKSTTRFRNIWGPRIVWNDGTKKSNKLLLTLSPMKHLVVIEMVYAYCLFMYVCIYASVDVKVCGEWAIISQVLASINQTLSSHLCLKCFRVLYTKVPFWTIISYSMAPLLVYETLKNGYVGLRNQTKNVTIYDRHLFVLFWVSITYPAIQWRSYVSLL